MIRILHDVIRITALATQTLACEDVRAKQAAMLSEASAQLQACEQEAQRAAEQVPKI